MGFQDLECAQVMAISRINVWFPPRRVNQARRLSATSIGIAPVNEQQKKYPLPKYYYIMVALRRLLVLLTAAAAGVHGAAMPEKAPDGDLGALACYNNPYTGFCEYCGSSNGFDAVVSVRMGPLIRARPR